jgi:uncharacterized protein
MKCFFVSDMHGKTDRYEKLFSALLDEKPDCLFMGGDLLPHGFSYASDVDDFTLDYLQVGFLKLREKLGKEYPAVFLILGNDDPRVNEETFVEIEKEKQLWFYMHQRKVEFMGYQIYGYAMIPPSPFGLKDWEKYDISRFVDPGCVPPTEGVRSMEPDENPEFATIQKDLNKLADNNELSKSLFLFHTPPYQSKLDRAALDGKTVEYVPLDVHVGSIAVKQFIEERKPLLTMHGHIHESSRLTGQWKEKINSTLAFNGATDSKHLALIKFDTENMEAAERFLI